MEHRVKYRNLCSAHDRFHNGNRWRPTLLYGNRYETAYSASTSESISITVDGSEPVFDTEAYITPSTGVVSDTVLTCSGLASDPDGGSVGLAYTWTNDTQSTTLGTNHP